MVCWTRAACCPNNPVAAVAAGVSNAGLRQPVPLLPLLLMFFLSPSPARLPHFHTRSLLATHSLQDVGRFRILGATLAQMPGWCSDLKYAAALGTSVWHLWRPSAARILGVKAAVGGRPLWVAASTHEGEEGLRGEEGGWGCERIGPRRDVGPGSRAPGSSG
jgi:hypothetical protein